MVLDDLEVKNMQFTQDEQAGNMIIRCEGRLDATSSPQLEAALNALVEKKQSKIAIDFEKVDYLSSAGMRLLLSMTKRLKTEGGKLVLCSIHDDVMGIIRMAGFEQILNIYGTEQEAMQSF